MHSLTGEICMEAGIEEKGKAVIASCICDDGFLYKIFLARKVEKERGLWNCH